MRKSTYGQLVFGDHDGTVVATLKCLELRGDDLVVELEREFQEHLTANKITEMVLDLGHIRYISSTGLRLLIFLRRHFHAISGQFRIANVNDDVALVFRTTRLFGEGFDFFPDVPAAVQSLRAGA